MTVLALSDLHGFLPEIPKCDLLLLGGDYCPTRNLEQEQRFILGPFKDWLQQISARYIVGIAGNHDFIFQYQPEVARDLPWIYLQDEVIELEGVKIYGTPWTPTFYDWAFMQSEPELTKTFASIPEGLDILLSHGPPYRMQDKNMGKIHCGSFALWDQVKTVKPDNVVFGHIHESHGIKDADGIRFYNVSYVNERYEPRYGTTRIDLRA